MPTLSSFFVIYTDGASLHEAWPAPPGATTHVSELSPLVLPANGEELFGPHVPAFKAFRPKRAFLVGFRRELKGRAESFFLEVRDVVLHLTQGLEGFALDVLRLVPFPLSAAPDALPEDLLAEDLYSVAIAERGEHGFMVETIGLSRLDQREITFEFKGRELIEEATLLCGHLADWVLEHPRRVEPGQAMSFGFDRLVFDTPARATDAQLRSWQPALVRRLLPEALFPGVGVLRVSSPPALPGDDQGVTDLTTALTRSMEQRLLLEELDLTGDAPHSSATAELRGEVTELRGITAVREESISAHDSGWRVRQAGTSNGTGGELMSLANLGARLPGLVRYFALPVGVKLAWDKDGQLDIDRSKVELDDDFDDALPEE